MKRSLTLFFTLLLIGCTKQNPVNKLNQNIIEPDILTRDGIDSVFATLDKITYANLDEDYKNYADPKKKFEKELKERSYYVVHKSDLSKKLIGNFRIKDFLCKDDYYKECNTTKEQSCAQFWLIDKEVIYMMLEIIHRLDENGHNMYGFHIRIAHRHPTFNESIDGAKYSQHIFGRAIDIGIDDINKDGESTQADKTIVYDLLQDIVGSRGGLGKYPGTMNLHFDCRGFKARWDHP